MCLLIGFMHEKNAEETEKKNIFCMKIIAPFRLFNCYESDRLYEDFRAKIRILRNFVYLKLLE